VFENGGDSVEKGSLPPPYRSPNDLCYRRLGQQAPVKGSQRWQTALVVKVPKCSA